jgi:hypothetical protein
MLESNYARSVAFSDPRRGERRNSTFKRLAQTSLRLFERNSQQRRENSRAATSSAHVPETFDSPPLR